MRLTITLGERESDVLAWLVLDGGGRPDTREEILEGLRAHGIDADEKGVSRALRTLHALSFVATFGGGEIPLSWYATDEGIAAFREAERRGGAA